MEDLKKLISRFYRTGFLLLGGLIVIAYGTLGFLYVQQGIKQKELNVQIATLSAIVSKPLSPIDELKREYDAITANLTAIDNAEAISRLLEIAEKHNIDTSIENGHFMVSQASVFNQKIGATSYRVLAFSGITVQGLYEDVTDFINDIDQNLTYDNIVITGIRFTEASSALSDIEIARIEEFQNVQDAVRDMMDDNGIYYIPIPVSVSRGLATNLMGDDPATEYIREGFPDANTPPIQKGYTGNQTIKNGYLLYEHDRVDSENTTDYSVVNYLDTYSTEYYYTCESNGTVKQWDNPVISKAEEYEMSESTVTELRVVVDLRFYTKE